jgi:hypothetical protein
MHDRPLAENSGIGSVLTLSSTVGPVDGCGGERPLTGSRAGEPDVGAGVAALVVWALEGRVDSREIGQFRQFPGDHYEGQFEGQNGANVCLSEPVSACVS